MEKYALVLEGGGMRGVYTAGALAWLNDHHITFDYGVGISSGAVALVCYMEENKTTPYNMIVKYACNGENVGLKAFLTEGHYVAYNRLFKEDLLGKEKLSLEPLRKNCSMEAEVGAYDLKKGETVFFNVKDLDDDLELLRGTCALPIASAVVDYEGEKYLDGGITKMIPIERSIEKGCTKHLVITTKPADYKRKPASKIVLFLMKLIYRKYPAIRKDYKVRHLNYYKQMDIIENLVEKEDAVLIRPSRTINISRFKGNPKDLNELYELGYQDMEDKKEEILSFLHQSNTINNLNVKEKELAK